MYPFSFSVADFIQYLRSIFCRFYIYFWKQGGGISKMSNPMCFLSMFPQCKTHHPKTLLFQKSKILHPRHFSFRPLSLPRLAEPRTSPKPHKNSAVMETGETFDTVRGLHIPLF